MPKKAVEPETRMEEKLNPLRLSEKDIYDVLGFLIKKHGVGPVVEQLKNYFEDQTEQAFGEVYQDRSDDSIQGLGRARAWDVCGVLLESLEEKINQYEMREWSHGKEN